MLAQSPGFCRCRLPHFSSWNVRLPPSSCAASNVLMDKLAPREGAWLCEIALYQAGRNVNVRSASIDRIDIEAIFRGKRSIGFRAAIEHTQNGDAPICSYGIAGRLRPGLSRFRAP